ncbi:alpha/beta hydrolase [Pseudomonas sp. NPDC090203]|uniref:alpha/beta hydrolase n=1 Tax=Pseudomonas sp. NPDC090203 TaxID=3364477 RepID=UPI0038248E88
MTHILAPERFTTLHISPEERQREYALREQFARFWATTPGEPRAVYDAFIGATPLATGTTLHAIDAPGASGWWVAPVDALPGQVLLYLHGGGYVQGSAAAYRGFVSQIARRTRTAALVIDYPLAPENTFLQATDAALAAWRWLIDQGYSRIALVGDSAGGGLALSTLASLSQSAEAIAPLAGVVFSPWVDLTFSGASMTDPNVEDPLIGHEYLKQCARHYLAGADPADPRASPLFASLEGLPPLLIQAGSDERLLDDSRQFAARARSAGVQVDLEIWEGMHHVFQLDLAHLHSSASALDRTAGFLRGAFNAA